MPQKNNQETKSEFEMVVTDVFALEGGRTVFAGEITSGPNYIRACDCELLIAGTTVAKFRIEDEMMPLHKAQKNLRSVSTIESIDVGLVQRAKGQCMMHGFRL